MDLLEQVCEDAWCSLKQLLELSDSDFRRLVSEELCYPVLDRPRLRHAWEEAKQRNDKIAETDPFRTSAERSNKRKHVSIEDECPKRPNLDLHPVPSTAEDEPRSEESSKDSDVILNKQVCEVCGVGGDIICCDSCILSFHRKCHIPSLTRVPDGKWLCSYCYATPGMTYCGAKKRQKARAAMEEMNLLKLSFQSSGKTTEHIPKVKDRFRIMHHQKGEKNFLGFTSPSWFFGIVTNVITNKKPKNSTSDWRPYTLHFKYNDGSKDIDGIGYPAADVQVLNVDYVTGSAFAEMDDGSLVLAYHRDMTKLAMGDLVDCLYQGGIENGACFRGRVAAIDREKKTCDVLYFDREYELNVPIDAANMCIVEEGQSMPNWLVGLKVPANFKNMDKCSRAGPNKWGPGKIVMFDQCGNGQDKELILKIAFPGGRFESATYSEVVPAVFAAILESTEAAKIKLWPKVSQEVRQDKDEEEGESGWQDEVFDGFLISSRKQNKAVHS